MTIPKKLYDTMKFLIGFIPYVVAILSGACSRLDVGDSTANDIIFWVSAAASLCDAFIKVAGKLHWKMIAENGDVTEIPTEETTNTGEVIADAAETESQEG